MGLIRRHPSKKGLFVQFPDGSIVESKSDMDRLMSDFTSTPSTYSNEGLQRSDIEAFSLASARLGSIGFIEEKFLAFGPVQLGQFPKSHNQYIADAILTHNYLIIYYQKNLLVPDFLIVSLTKLSGLSSTGPWSAEFNFKDGILREKKGAFEMAETFFELSERLGKDGHANRRSITFMRSLANTLNEVHKK